MKTQQKLIQRKHSLLDLASHVGNVSEARDRLGFSWDSFYSLMKGTSSGEMNDGGGGGAHAASVPSFKMPRYWS